jgi:hypothetical protein
MAVRSDRQANSNDELTVATRLDRLFKTFHSRNEPEQSDAVVAESVGEILGRPVTARAVAEARAGIGVPDPKLLAGLAHHFGVREDYLLGSGVAAKPLHDKLKLLADARDAGMQRLALRGGISNNTEVLDKVLAILDRVDGGVDGGKEPVNGKPGNP